MKKHSIYYSQFVREFSFNGLWLDFWIVTLSSIVFIAAPLFRENPIKVISTLFAVRALMTDKIGIHEAEEVGLTVITSDDLNQENDLCY